jgi:hypothetical protein
MNHHHHLRDIKMMVFWDVTPCDFIDIYQRFAVKSSWTGISFPHRHRINTSSHFACVID